MCRIAVIDSQMPRLPTFLEGLVTAGGGDGNGLGVFSSTGAHTLIKGVKVSVKELLKHIKPGVTALFHTRKTSVGSVCDLNCQPIRIPKRNAMLVHNGSWNFHKEAKLPLLLQQDITITEYKKMSDSVCLAHILDKVGLSFLETVDSGVYVVATPKGFRAYIQSGWFYAMQIKRRWYYATEIPKIITDRCDKLHSFDNNTIADISGKGYHLRSGSITESNNAELYQNAYARNTGHYVNTTKKQPAYSGGFYHGGYYR